MSGALFAQGISIMVSVRAALFAAFCFALPPVGSALAQQPAQKPATAAEVRPPAAIMLDCAQAPKNAVTKLPDDLARWATVYCTKLGHIFNANDKYFAAFPDSGVRASFSAAEMSGVGGEPGHGAFFTNIAYSKLSDAETNALIDLDPSVRKILVGQQLWRLDLTTNANQALAFVVINPAGDPFWVFPLTGKGLGTPAFYVISLATLGRAR